MRRRHTSRDAPVGAAVERPARTGRLRAVVALHLPALAALGVAAGRTWIDEGAPPVPWLGGLVALVLSGALGLVVLGRTSAAAQRRAATLAGDLARSEAQVDRRASVAELFVHLARRNQALLDRQIGLLVQMEEREADADALAHLFRVDHLATRIRRNAESLLVLSGEETPRRWGRPVALADVARAAVSEVEDFRRAEVAIDDDLAVAGRAVADLAHLLAELVENGLQFSPPETRVRITSRRTDGGCDLRIEDHGIGMASADRLEVNSLLATVPEVDLGVSRRLGLHVVARLAARYGASVVLQETSGGGTTAVVRLPDTVVTEPDLGGTGPGVDDGAAGPVGPAWTTRVAAAAPAGPAPVTAGVAPAASARPTTPVALAAWPGSTSSPVDPSGPAHRPPAPAGGELPHRSVARGAASDELPHRSPAAGADALPRRRPQEQLHPSLGAAPVATTSPGGGRGAHRSREDARAMLTRFQAHQARARARAHASADEAAGAVGGPTR